MRAAWAVSALALLAVCGGCSSEPGVEAGGVRQSGQDSYMATGRSRGGNAGVLIAQSAALQDARTFCEAQGRRFIAARRPGVAGAALRSGDVHRAVPLPLAWLARAAAPGGEPRPGRSPLATPRAGP